MVEGGGASQLQELFQADGLQDNLVVVHSGQPNSEFQVGQIELADGNLAALILIAFVDGRFLVAVPTEVWHRKAGSRKLDSKALVKPIQCAVACCLNSDRGTQLADTSIRVWIGFLASESENSVSFMEDAEITYGFSIPDADDVVPFAPALVEVAQERFTFCQQSLEEEAFLEQLGKTRILLELHG